MAVAVNVAGTAAGVDVGVVVDGALVRMDEVVAAAVAGAPVAIGAGVAVDITGVGVAVGAHAPTAQSKTMNKIQIGFKRYPRKTSCARKRR
jgi:hypothetical protein